MKALVLYYSYSGNTGEVAQRIRKALDCDIAEIVPVEPYPEDFNAVVEQGKREIQSGYEPEIQPLRHDPAQYDTIILGSPVWWYTFVPPVQTVLSAVDWEGKAVYPFATHAGWLGKTLENIGKACGGAAPKPGLDVRFDADRPLTPWTAVDQWTGRIKEGR
ncbi:MAG: flavodoxin [Candidatus Limiplasma sp.]|nr:flavodoxin [Candidatus Limiplasma sp.]